MNETNENGNPRMSCKEAVFHLMRLAERRNLREDEVVALQMGAKQLVKRQFENCRRRARHGEERRIRLLACQGSAKTEESCQTLANPPAAACQPPAMEEEIRQTLAKAEGGAA
ncbi:MAG: hypothetical protein IJS32_02525 [Kiritimatiellae bacterium]|nr:hypothetical protein [Kiritimatiellia bacterium]